MQTIPLETPWKLGDHIIKELPLSGNPLGSICSPYEKLKIEVSADKIGLDILCHKDEYTSISSTMDSDLQVLLSAHIKRALWFSMYPFEIDTLPVIENIDQARNIGRILENYGVNQPHWGDFLSTTGTWLQLVRAIRTSQVSDHYSYALSLVNEAEKGWKALEGLEGATCKHLYEELEKVYGNVSAVTKVIRQDIQKKIQKSPQFRDIQPHGYPHEYSLVSRMQDAETQEAVTTLQYEKNDLFVGLQVMGLHPFGAHLAYVLLTETLPSDAAHIRNPSKNGFIISWRESGSPIMEVSGTNRKTKKIHIYDVSPELDLYSRLTFLINSDTYVLHAEGRYTVITENKHMLPALPF